jgi:hypothetical protein
MEGNLVEQITAKVAALPPEKQREVLTLIEALEERADVSAPSRFPRHRRLKGATAGEGPTLSRQALKDARKEMWGEYLETEE